jgi:glycosyltransferase involved in cell wall biosynthesis
MERWSQKSLKSINQKHQSMDNVLNSGQVRIGFVISHLSHGGAQRQLYELARSINPKHFQCFVYSLSEMISPYSGMIREAGATLRVLKRQGHFEIYRIFKLATLLRKDRVDILHSFLFVANGYAWPAALLAGVPHLITSARNCKEIGFLRGWVNRIAFLMSDAIACNGDAVRSYVTQQYHAPLDRSVVIHNGLDLARFETVPAGLEETPTKITEDKNPIVMTIGRLVPQKDLPLFLEAAALLARRAPKVRFVIVGDGPCRADLARYASKNGLDGDISFLGEREDIPQLLANADVFWLTSKWEGLPNVLLEAMACGKPVVARDVGSCREVVSHGKTGYLVAGRDAEEFAEVTLGLLSSPVHARAMGLAGRQLIEDKFSVAQMSRATEALYRSLLDSPIGAAS